MERVSLASSRALYDKLSEGRTAAIDTPDAQAMLAELDRGGWRPTHIFNTHHADQLPAAIAI